MLERLNQALNHLEACLDREVDMAEVARIATVSEYHFRRLFSALAGMPLPVYVRRRRMTLAAAEVLDGELTLLDVAVRYGYGSGEAFARAFRSVHGIGPGEARRTGAVLTAQPRMSFRVVVEGSTTMRYRIVEKESFRIVGRKARVPLVHEGVNAAAAAHVEGLDEQAIVRMKELAGREPEGILSAAVYLTDSREEGAEADYWIGAATGPETAADELDVLDVPAGTWAVFDNHGPYPSALQELWRDVFTQWFPSNPYASRPGPELLRTQPVEIGAETDSQLWIPVERSSGSAGA
ncbi:AraC family transcriptional regulator [Streptomyces sp. NBC_01340]|uniref:AraC family transcriptional regulator n=1 Tax=unclassified Streptomyces TaxID=2593676 RepID=UPI0022570934|nr:MULTISPECIES: AraC family transcriptional regulator [unclassified Streptomyces]MCX4458283.1 AraC family transcriptional regulator [Streptomyces sp. NBC_01719]MCX4497640.1 AraC family transcriptional regulator [Streptomyces sp. NBC_01728]WSI42465.1 AraC family transcriptional regulator [Streptomyces sp. NBC_01340]